MLIAVATGFVLWWWAHSNDAVSKHIRTLIESRTRTGSVANRVAALLIFIALCMVFNPEMRALLLFVDAIGIDVVLLVVLFQVQAGLMFVRTDLLKDVWRSFCNWPPLPFGRPSVARFRQHPFWTVYSAIAPTLVAGFLLSVALLLVQLSRAFLHTFV
jgi:hypothetical protein